MKLACDIGNSNIVIGVFSGDRLQKAFRLKTQLTPRQLASGLARAIGKQKISRISIASVVPLVTKQFTQICRNLFSRASIKKITHKHIQNIKIAIKNPAHIGIDRLINADFAYKKFKRDLIVIDMGTATTFDCVKNGRFVGGVIAVGLNMMRDGLTEKTALLPKITPQNLTRAIGRDTETAMNAGLMLGYAALVDGLVERLKKEMRAKPMIIATGGIAQLMKRHLKNVDLYEQNLTISAINSVSL